jgi:hypothetical protein
LATVLKTVLALAWARVNEEHGARCSQSSQLAIADAVFPVWHGDRRAAKPCDEFTPPHLWSSTLDR